MCQQPHHLVPEGTLCTHAEAPVTPLGKGTDGSWMLPKALVVEVGLEQGGKFDFFFLLDTNKNKAV